MGRQSLTGVNPGRMLGQPAGSLTTNDALRSSCITQGTCMHKSPSGSSFHRLCRWCWPEATRAGARRRGRLGLYGRSLGWFETLSQHKSGSSNATLCKIWACAFPSEGHDHRIPQMHRHPQRPQNAEIGISTSRQNAYPYYVLYAKRFAHLCGTPIR